MMSKLASVAWVAQRDAIASIYIAEVRERLWPLQHDHKCGLESTRQKFEDKDGDMLHLGFIVGRRPNLDRRVGQV